MESSTYSTVFVQKAKYSRKLRKFKKLFKGKERAQGTEWANNFCGTGEKASSSEQADMLWSLSPGIYKSIRAHKGQTTTKMAAFGYPKPWSYKYAQTLGTS